MNGFGEGLHRVPWDPVAQKFWDPPLPASQGTCGVPVEETLTHSHTLGPSISPSSGLLYMWLSSRLAQPTQRDVADCAADGRPDGGSAMSPRRQPHEPGRFHPHTFLCEYLPSPFRYSGWSHLNPVGHRIRYGRTQVKGQLPTRACSYRCGEPSTESKRAAGLGQAMHAHLDEPGRSARAKCEAAVLRAQGAYGSV